MDPPVLRAAPQLGCLFDQHQGGIGFLEEKQNENERAGAKNARDIRCPAPAKVALDDVATDKGSQKRPGEDGHGEGGDGQASVGVVKHVREDGGHHGNGTGAKEAAEKATQHDGLEILGGGHGELEDGETKGAEDQRQPAALQFGQGGPDQGAGGITKDEQGQAEDADLDGHPKQGRDLLGDGGEDAARKGRDDGGPRQDDAGGQLALQGPVLRMQGVVEAVELDDILLALGQGGGVGLASAKGGQGLPGASRAEAGTNGRAVLRALGDDPAQGGDIALQVVGSASRVGGGHAGEGGQMRRRRAGACTV